MNRFATTFSVAILAMLSASPAWSQHDSFDGDDDRSGELTALLLVAGCVVGGVAATAPLWGPIMAADDDYSKQIYFTEYPYKHGMHGNMAVEPSEATECYDWCLQAETAYVESFGRFRRVDMGVQWEGTRRIGIDTEFNFWQEADTPDGNHSFWTGDLNLMFRFAQCEWLQARAGLGGVWLVDGDDNDNGINFTYKVDLFVGDPLILSGELDWGKLGDEMLFHPRVTLGAQWHRAEMFIGCDYFDIGSAEATSLIVGGRFWY